MVEFSNEEKFMRYFNFILKASSEQIKEQVKIKLKEYDYQSPVAAMNNYMYKHMKNGICYFAYREEGDTTLATFSYDEKKGSFSDAYEYILEMLNERFCQLDENSRSSKCKDLRLL